MISITLHGVRGSTPAVSLDNSKYGGNTFCFEIQTDNQQIVVDAGTGFGTVNLNKEHKNTYLLFSHLHHDHIQGLLFNQQLFARKTKLFISSGLMSGRKLKKHLETYFSPPFFPPSVFDNIACFHFVDFDCVVKNVHPELQIMCTDLNHPGGAVGYSFLCDGKKVVVLLDNEFTETEEQKLSLFCNDADLLIWDGMFTEQELVSKRGWGHSSIEQADQFTKKYNVKRTVICHHAPSRTDEEIDSFKARLTHKNVEFGAEKSVFVL